MLEYPEARVLAAQINNNLINRQVMSVVVNRSPHKFAWFKGDPNAYPALLQGRSIKGATAFGGMVEIDFDGVLLVIGDGTSLTWYPSDAAVPPKHQLLLDLDDRSTLVCSVQMYGGIWAFPKDTFENPYYIGAKKGIPLTDPSFTYELFADKARLFGNLSLKAFLATEQRFVGLGNGVLQDILFKAKLHPKAKVPTLDDPKLKGLYQAIVDEIKSMIKLGGRVGETDLFNRHGGYVTIGSRYANKETCPNCQASFVKEPYMGGSIYYCPNCQPLVK
ncbi:MAG: endonuclease VIII [Bacilli bacterium]